MMSRSFLQHRGTIRLLGAGFIEYQPDTGRDHSHSNPTSNLACIFHAMQLDVLYISYLVRLETILTTRRDASSTRE